MESPSRATQSRGRCLNISEDPADAGSHIVFLKNEAGTHRFRIKDPGSVSPGDWIEIREGSARVLTPNRTERKTLRWTQQILDPRRIRGNDMRQQVLRLTREFFLARSYREVRTPLLVPCPGMETHIRTFQVQSGEHPLFLPTSPEFAMKRLLAGGLERIFQITPAFRDEPASVTHLPEFTMLEWYQAYAGYAELMSDTEELFEFLALKIHGQSSFVYQGRKLSVQTPWPRLRVRDLFREHAGIDLLSSSTREALAAEARRLGLKVNPGETWDDIYFNIWLNRIESRLPQDQAFFVIDYPPSQAALAVVAPHEDGTPWARRFEAYAAGLELCNGFEELTDPIEQRRRFQKDMELRTQLYGEGFPPTPIDEEFLEALTEGMPPAGGNALGMDRLIMMLADEPDIRYTVWLP